MAVDRCKWCGSLSHDCEDCPQQTCDFCQQLGHHNTRCKHRQQQAMLAPSPEPDYSAYTCGHCQQLGHIKRFCPVFWSGSRCYSCNQFGHIAPYCPIKPYRKPQPASPGAVPCQDQSSNHSSRSYQAALCPSSAVPQYAAPDQQASSASDRTPVSSASASATLHQPSTQLTATAPAADVTALPEPTSHSKPKHGSEAELGGFHAFAANKVQKPHFKAGRRAVSSRQDSSSEPVPNAPAIGSVHPPLAFDQQPRLATLPETEEGTHAQAYEHPPAVSGWDTSLGHCSQLALDPSSQLALGPNSQLAFEHAQKHRTAGPVQPHFQAQPPHLPAQTPDTLFKEEEVDVWDESKADAPFALLPDAASSAACTSKTLKHFRHTPSRLNPQTAVNPARHAGRVSTPRQHSVLQDSSDARNQHSPPLHGQMSTPQGHPGLPRSIIQPGMDAPLSSPPAPTPPPHVASHDSSPSQQVLNVSYSPPMSRSAGPMDPIVPAPTRSLAGSWPVRYEPPDQADFDPTESLTLFTQQELLQGLPHTRQQAYIDNRGVLSAVQHRPLVSSIAQPPMQATSPLHSEPFGGYPPTPATAAATAACHALRGLIDDGVPGSPGKLRLVHGRASMLQDSLTFCILMSIYARSQCESKA